MAAVMGASVLGLTVALDGPLGKSWLLLGLQVATGAIVYGGLLATLDRAYVREMRGLLATRRADSG